ncbi:nucleotidyltransferase family protein [Candidatus Marinarcus aquaticus]|uniref:Alcohol dehydrogenase n=1 Tax=Candidatus Marinarcus aquaticus TaxID=2044504 RepID=A0A4Q0XQR0_9BACT|nr:nucleotidyltransferase family protein [Candidatus Marinarcus aquaticus]RXJ55373.1 alcohol dehydrogenase [Candidatus Marinarcus aquaticus]
MKEIQDITVSPLSTIKEALSIIDSGAMKIAIVIDKNKKVIGTITDGDIRRGLLNGLNLDSAIESIYFKNPTLANINESKEAIIQKAIHKKLYQIPIVNDQGHLVDIEDLATLLKITTRKNRVVLMAGGLGTRLHPLTQKMPKPLLKVGNKPILETIIENFSKYGFVNITISVNYKAEMIKEYFGDGSKFGVCIDYIEESQRLGTAGALSLLPFQPKEPFFVMNADLLTNVNFTHLLDFHIHEHATATMCVREYDYQIPYGVIQTQNSSITSIKEKPIETFFVNAGIYVLSPEVLHYIPKNSFYDMPTLFEQLISKEHKAISFPLHEYWLDIGRMSDFEEAQNEYFKVFDE